MQRLDNQQNKDWFFLSFYTKFVLLCGGIYYAAENAFLLSACISLLATYQKLSPDYYVKKMLTS